MKRGLTLIELLAVIVILSLLIGMGATGLAAAGRSASLHSAAAAWQDLDAGARLQARSAGPLVMDLDLDGKRLRLRGVDDEALLAEVVLPPGTSGELAPRPVTFDRLGQSPDYDAAVVRAAIATRFRVHGLTGLVTEAR